MASLLFTAQHGKRIFQVSRSRCAQPPGWLLNNSQLSATSRLSPKGLFLNRSGCSFLELTRKMCEETWPSWWLLLLQKPPRPPELCQVPVAPLPGSGSVLQQPGGDMKYLRGKSPFCARGSGSSSSSCSEIHSTERKAQTRGSLWVLYLVGIRHKRRKTPVLVWDRAKPTVSKRLENPSESPGIKLVGITASSMNFLGK